MGGNYSDLGMEFDWNAYLNGIPGFELKRKNGILYGLMYLTPEKAMWALDIFIEAVREDNEIAVYTHPLRVTSNHVGWDVHC